MTPGARMAATVEIWSEIESGNLPADVIVGMYFRSRRYAGAKDRRSISNTIYDILRKTARLKWWIERADLGLAADSRTLMIAAAALDAGNGLTDLEHQFSGATHCPPPLSDIERTLISRLDGQPLSHPDQPRWVALEYPEWLDRAFESLWGASLEAEIAALNQAAPLDLRVNTLKATRDQAMEQLAADGVQTRPTPYSPLGLRVEGHPRLGGTRAYQNGLVEIQDEGSQLISLMTEAKPGHRIVDFCAGAGGKSLAMAADMGVGGRAKGWITACDVSQKRLKRMNDRLKRAGVRNVRQRVLVSEQDPWIMDQAGKADRVLVDAPCSGTGTWRRGADAKWRLNPARLANTMLQQGRILDSAAHLVAPGGRLVYATCSVLREENQRQIEAFLDKHEHFHALPIDPIWAKTVGGDCPDGGNDLSLTPARNGTDGFYCAVLERQA